jgi:hypothetical protein
MSVSVGHVAAWSAALDDIEAGLSSDAMTPLTWAVPADLGPLPAELVPRAERLVVAVDAVHAELAASAAVLLEELDTLGGTAASGSGPTSRRRVHASEEPPPPRLVDHDA